ncbi:transposase family protein [Nostoc punctiforme UO1]
MKTFELISHKVNTLGAQGWEDIEEYGINKQEWLETFLELPFGIPSPDTC